MAATPQYADTIQREEMDAGETQNFDANCHAWTRMRQRSFEFPEFPAEGPKLESILDAEIPDKYTLTDHPWN